jgi:hypothetical protein
MSFSVHQFSNSAPVHTGDSDFIPEMKGLGPDVALLPISGT